MQKLLLVYYYSETRATSRIRNVLPNMVFPPIWGEKMAEFWARACKLSWTLFSSARVQPLYGAGRKESSGTGLSPYLHVVRSYFFEIFFVALLFTFVSVPKAWSMMQFSFPFHLISLRHLEIIIGKQLARWLSGGDITEILSFAAVFRDVTQRSPERRLERRLEPRQRGVILNLSNIFRLA